MQIWWYITLKFRVLFSNAENNIPFSFWESYKVYIQKTVKTPIFSQNHSFAQKMNILS